MNTIIKMSKFYKWFLIGGCVYGQVISSAIRLDSSILLGLKLHYKNKIWIYEKFLLFLMFS